MAQTNAERLAEIASVFASYGFGHLYRIYVKSDNEQNDAIKFRKAFEDLGPSFIKIGQILSTRNDLLPDAYIQEMQKLQADTTSFPFEIVEEIFFKEFDQPLEEAFEYVNPTPLASASIAQVHRARLHNGDEVIIKVQRPEIEENLIRDIRLLSRVLSVAPHKVTEVLIDIDAAFDEIEKSTVRELDFNNEASALIRFRSNNNDLAVVNAPKPYLKYTSKRILVEEYISGITGLNKEEIIKADYVPEDIGEKLLYSFLTQVFRDGFYHGDPHPGNLIIKDRQIYFLDFGIYGEISDGNKQNLIDLLRYVFQQDIAKIMKLLLQMTETSGRVDQIDLYDDLSYLFDTYMNRSFENIKMQRVFNDLLKVVRVHKMTMPHDFIILTRAFVIIEGVLSKLTPSTNVLQAAKTFIRHEDHIDFLDLPSKERLLLTTYENISDLYELPSGIRKLIDNLNSGRTVVNVGLADRKNRWKEVNQMVNRIIFAVIIASLILASSIIIATETGRGISIFAVIIFIGAGFMGIWLLVSIIRSGML